MDTDLEVIVSTDKCPRLGKAAVKEIALEIQEVLTAFDIKAEVEVSARTVSRITAVVGGEDDDA